MSDDVPQNFNHLNVYRDGKVLYVEIDNPPINLITVPLLFDFINLTKWVEDDEDSTVLVLKSVVDGFFIAHLMLALFSLWTQIKIKLLIH